MSYKHINIKYPITEGSKGFYFESNETTRDSIISDILHILATKRGERFFDPYFGTNLHTFLFEPNDSITLSDIKNELKESLDSIMPNIQVIKLDVMRDIETNEAVSVHLVVVDTDDVFLDNIIIELEIKS